MDTKVSPRCKVKAPNRSLPARVALQPGSGAAVIRSVGDYEKAEDKRAFMRAVVAS